MSYTELYKFNKKGNAEDYGEIRNSHRGAMAVWRIMDDKYLPPYTPEWAKVFGKEKVSRATGIGDEIKEIWELFNDPKVSRADKIVLGSTFDNVIVKRENLEELFKAFNDFDGETSLKEQVELLKDYEKDNDLIAIAWNQTSVCADNWTNFGGYTNEDESIPYNMLTMDKHWSLFDEL